MAHCFRCEHELLDITPDKVSEISFFGCQNCGCQYAKKPTGLLHDRWQMPLTIVLYDLIYEKEPLARLERVVQQTKRRKQIYIETLIEHIDSELKNPKQQLTDMHDFVHLNEQQLRAFLTVLVERLKADN